MSANKAPTFSDKLKQVAKNNKLTLLCFDVDGRPAKTSGRATFHFAVEAADAEKLLAEVTALFSAWCAKGGA